MSKTFAFPTALVGVTLAILTLTASSPARAQVGADWSSSTTGTLGASSITLSGLSNDSQTSLDLSGANFSAAPLSSSQETIGYGVSSDWTATFSVPISNLNLYAVFWRGSAAGVNPVDYLFS